MRIDILTLFPAMFLGPLQESILKRAQQRGLLTVLIHQLRDYAFDRHQMTDDIPYGGGEGMVMKPEPVFRAVTSILDRDDKATVILMTPQGRTFTQQTAKDLAQKPRLFFVCGHYGGFDERIRNLATDELSIGDYVLTGGELAAMVVIDAVARWVPGVLGALESAQQDSYAQGLLEGPQYTHPASFRGDAVPEVLLSGNHARIARWRREQALKRTFLRRPDLLATVDLSPEDQAYLAHLKQTLKESQDL